MAIEYELYLATERSGEDVASTISACTPGSHAKALDDVSIVAAERFEVRVTAFHGSELVMRYVERPTVSVYFRLDKLDLPGARRAVAGTIAQLVHRFSGDMVLTWNWERIVALRSGTELLISNDSDLKAELTQRLSVPYRIGTIPDHHSHGDE